MKMKGLGSLMRSSGLRISATTAKALGLDAEGPKRNKFGARKKEVDGITFDSTKEAKRYQSLKLLEQTGQIRELKTQVEYLLIPSQKKSDGKAERAAHYTADFVYRTRAGDLVVEDVKSTPTRTKPDYILRRKLMLMVHDIEIKEV